MSGFLVNWVVALMIVFITNQVTANVLDLDI